MIFAAISLFFLVSWALLVMEPVSSFVCRSRSITVQSIHLSRSLVVYSNPYPCEESTPTEDDGDEETLLRLRLSLKPNISMDEALNKVQAYTQSFPFAAVLPVQPLQYLPTLDGGVDVLFLRKKTAEKGSVDGGVRFFVSGHDGINVLVKRNSQGQVIPKTFSEKQIVQAYVKGISGEDEGRSGMAPTEAVAIESVFHKWL